jgi:hypothetical protein
LTINEKMNLGHNSGALVKRRRIFLMTLNDFRKSYQLQLIITASIGI